MEGILIVMNRITQRDDALDPMHAAFDQRQGDRVLPGYQSAPDHQLKNTVESTTVTGS